MVISVKGKDPEEQLAPFDENLETPRYIKYTKSQLIVEQREEIENYKNGNYAEFLRDPEAYKAGCSNKTHIEYLESIFPKKLEWTDEEIYQDVITWYDDVGENGEVYSEYNPNSKWDWYSLGGRWSGLIKLKEGANGVVGKPGVGDNEVGIDQARKGDIANFDEICTFALLKDGIWYEKGQMGWWACVSNEDEN
jgi:hypothetical protein